MKGLERTVRLGLFVLLPIHVLASELILRLRGRIVFFSQFAMLPELLAL